MRAPRREAGSEPEWKRLAPAAHAAKGEGKRSFDITILKEAV